MNVMNAYGIPDENGAAVVPQAGDGAVQPMSAAPSFAGGGAIDDGDEDDVTGDASPNTDVVDYSNAMDMVRKALDYGRQKNGLPASRPQQARDSEQQAPAQDDSGIPDDSQDDTGDEGYAEGGTIQDDIEASNNATDDGPQYGKPEQVDDPDRASYSGAPSPPISGDNLDMSGHMGNESEGLNVGEQDNSGAAPVAGAIPDQGDNSGAAPVAGQEGQYASGTPLKYLQGADAMPNQQALSIEEQVARENPQAAHDPNAKTMLAVQKAGEMDGPAASFAYTQRNRQAYDASMSHALVGARKGDLKNAAESATKAYVYLPEASDVRFSAANNGITATVKDLNTDKIQKFDLTPQQFVQAIDISKDGQFDKVIAEGGMGAVLQKMTAQGQQGQTQEDPNRPQNRVTVHAMGEPDQFYQNGQNVTPTRHDNKMEEIRAGNEYKRQPSDYLAEKKLGVEGAQKRVETQGQFADTRNQRTNATKEQIAAKSIAERIAAREATNGRNAATIAQKALTSAVLANPNILTKDKAVKAKWDEMVAGYSQQPSGQQPQAPQQKAPQQSSQDQQALLWANANPNDPRAAQIKRLHGVQ